MTGAPVLDRGTLAWLHVDRREPSADAAYTPGADLGVLGPSARELLAAADVELAALQRRHDETAHASMVPGGTDVGPLPAVPADAARHIRQLVRRGASVAPSLEPLLAHADPAPRRAAVDGLGALAHAPAAGALEPLLASDPDAAVRQAAALALASIASAHALGDVVGPLLERAMADDADPGVRLAAERALGRLFPDLD